MPVDYTDPIVFAPSAAALCWWVIEAIAKPVLSEWEWWASLSDEIRGAVWKLLILLLVIPWGWIVFDDLSIVIPVAVSAVIGAGGLHNEVRKRTQPAQPTAPGWLTQEE